MLRRRDGIGRRAGLKIPWWRHRIGSTPIAGTKEKTTQDLLLGLLFFVLRYLIVKIFKFIIPDADQIPFFQAHFLHTLYGPLAFNVFVEVTQGSLIIEVC